MTVWWTRSRSVLAWLALALSGCGAAQLAMKSPISNQCASVGLKGCPELVDGVMEYVGGDRASAETKLRSAASANNPEQLQKFASAIEPIGAGIGGDTGEAIKGVAAILRGPAGKTTETSPATKAGGGAAIGASTGATATAVGASAGRPPPNVVVEELRAATERPATDPRRTLCGGILGSDPKCMRVRAYIGPLVVTNVYASGGCPDELFLISGRADKPHWVLLNNAGAAMNVAGQFIVEDGEELFAGVRATGSAGPKDDLKCSVTWSGFKPVTTGSKKLERYLDE